MRGRSLLKEPPTPSICAFCAHRLGTARRPSHVQRRFLQSSSSHLKPPAEGAALREENDYESTNPRIPQPAAASWGLSAGIGNTPGPTGSFGSTAIPSAVPQGSWGSSFAGGIGIPQRPDSSPVPDQVQGAGSTQSVPKLLPHEQRARDLIAERNQKAQARHVKIHAGPGPEFNRAGKPLPYSQEERMQIAKEAAERRSAMETHSAIKQRTEYLTSNVRHVMGDSENSAQSGVNTRDTNDSSQWGQLRRRAEETPVTAPRDSFAEARAKREEQANSATYTPLGNRTISERGMYEKVPRADMWSRSNTYSQGTDNISRMTSTNSASARSIWGAQGRPGEQNPREGAVGDKSRATWPGAFQNGSIAGQVGGFGNAIPQRSNSSQESQQSQQSQQSEQSQQSGTADEKTELYSPLKAPQAAEEVPDVRTQVVEKYTSPAELEIRRRKLSSRFDAGDTPLEDMPKGKAKDKAKRRQRFAKDIEEEDEAGSLAALERAELKKQRKREKAAKKAAAPTPILLPEYISVSNLAVALKVKLENFIEKMEELGFEETTHDHILNAENAGLIAMEYNFEPIIERGESEDLKARPAAEDPSILPQRAPVVTIMGHVDHGKTTILDYLRKSSVAATEHGGITQHIGAFSVPMSSGKTITFLDTPGHAAFLSMRQRGANVTDIVILVVAADDSVKPQTIEAINHAKSARVPIIVAINKIDKDEINIDRVKQDLARHGVDVEDYGGDTQVVCVSGMTGQGMDELEEAAVTLTEILDMRAETDGPAEGWVIEASIKSMGKVATVLVRRGTMRPGDFIVAGRTWARIRCLRNEAGVEIEEAGPGTPVEIDGWREQPIAGDEVLQAPDEAKAKSVVDYRLEKEERDKMAEDMEAINEHRKIENEKREREKAEKAAALAGEELAEEELAAVTSNTKASGPKPVYFIVKGDVSGSVEAVIDSIQAVGTKEVAPVILRSGVGQLHEFDIEHAASAKGTLINFNTAIEPHISRLAEESKVPILNHNIIYRLVDDVRAELSKHLPPLVTQRVLGEAEVAQIFEINIKGRKYKSVAGCKVRNGTVAKTARYRVMREGEKIFDGSLETLKNQKKEVSEMRKGGECGMEFVGWSGFQRGDLIQAYEEIREKRYL